MNELKRKFNAQKGRAKSRGIEWNLTFEQWVEWWGADIEQRGNGKHNLQMQRYGDMGAYELGNIKKGFPADNMKTKSNCLKNKRAEKARIEYQKYLDSLMQQPSKESREEEYSAIEEGSSYSRDNSAKNMAHATTRY